MAKNKKLSKNTVIALCFFGVYVIIFIIGLINSLNIDLETMKESAVAGYNSGSSLAENGTMGDLGLSTVFDLKTTLVSIVRIAAFVCSIIFGAKALKEINKEVLPGKPLALLSIIGPIILFVIQSTVSMVIAFNAMKETGIMDQFKCMSAIECIDSGNGTSTCILDGDEIECSNSVLNESQYEGYEEQTK